MDTLGKWDGLLLRAQNLHFREAREDLTSTTTYDKFTKLGDTSEADYRSMRSAGLGLMSYTQLGGSAHLDQYTPGPETVHNYKKWTIATVWPEELPKFMKDNGRTKKDLVNLFTKKVTGDFAKSEIRTREYIALDPVVRATSTTPTVSWQGVMADGLAMASNSHVSLRGGVPIRTLQTASVMNMMALSEGAKVMAGQPSPEGFPQGGLGDIGVLHGRFNHARLMELLAAQNTPDVALTSNPNLLTLKLQGQGKFVPVLDTYLPETFTGWLLFDMKNHYMKRFPKWDGEINSDVDALTGNLVQRFVQMFSIFVDSPNGTLFNPGI